jgi:CMP-N-acetylneuraminic acid synthetase
LLTDWVVSTEDLEIANLALSYGAFVVKRPESLAHDDTTSGAVVRHALDWMEVDRVPYDMVVLLHPTSPIRDPNHIDEAIRLLHRSQLDTLASVCMLPRKTHENVKCLINDRLIDRAYEDIWANCIYNGSIYAMRSGWIKNNNEHTCSISVPLVMDRFHSLDVDEEIDLKLGELYLDALSS